MKRRSKKWFKEYFGFDPDPEKKYKKIIQTDGGTSTRDFDKIENADLIHQSSSKTYWGVIK